MNNAFKQNKILVLSENYLIKPDNANGVVLVFSEERTRTKYDDILDESHEEKYTFKEEYHYPRVAQALRKFVDMEIMVEENIETMIDKSDKLYSLIDKIDKTFKQF